MLHDDFELELSSVAEADIVEYYKEKLVEGRVADDIIHLGGSKALSFQVRERDVEDIGQILREVWLNDGYITIFEDEEDTRLLVTAEIPTEKAVEV